MPLVVTQTIHRTRGRLNQLGIAVTTNASGDAAVTTVGAVFGRLVGVEYKPGTLDTGADWTITDTDTGATIFSLTNAGTTARSFRPTALVTNNVGGTITNDNTAPNLNRDIYLAGKVSAVVAQGGNVLTGTLYLILQEE